MTAVETWLKCKILFGSSIKVCANCAGSLKPRCAFAFCHSPATATTIEKSTFYWKSKFLLLICVGIHKSDSRWVSLTRLMVQVLDRFKIKQWEKPCSFHIGTYCHCCLNIKAKVPAAGHFSLKQRVRTSTQVNFSSKSKGKNNVHRMPSNNNSELQNNLTSNEAQGTFQGLYSFCRLLCVDHYLAYLATTKDLYQVQ